MKDILFKKYILSIKIDNELSEQVIGHFDYPYLMIDTFDKNYLTLSDEIIEVTLKTHQRVLLL